MVRFCSMAAPLPAAGATASFTAGFVVDTRTAIGKREIFGPFQVDPGRKTIMRSSSGFQPEQASHLESSEMCATCHTLFAHTLGPDGETIGELPEQVPYLEWRHGGYARDDDSFREGGDRIRYSVALGRAQGPFRIEAELWCQPIAYRWAYDLRLREAAETNRFAGMYQSMAGASAITLARAVASAHQSSPPYSRSNP